MEQNKPNGSMKLTLKDMAFIQGDESILITEISPAAHSILSLLAHDHDLPMPFEAFRVSVEGNEPDRVLKERDLFPSTQMPQEER